MTNFPDTRNIIAPVEYNALEDVICNGLWERFSYIEDRIYIMLVGASEGMPKWESH